MSITQDNDTYEQQQLHLLRDLLLAVKDELESADLDHDQVAELTGRIGYAVASVIDGEPTGEGVSARPRLAFATAAGPDHLIVNDRGSYLHELVYSLFAEVFDAIEDDEDGYEDEEFDEEESDEEFEDDDFDDGDDDDVPPGRIH